MTPERLAELETKAKHPEWRFAAPKATILDLIAHIRDLEAPPKCARGCGRDGVGSPCIHELSPDELTGVATHLRDLEAQAITADMGGAILDEIAGTLKELGCSHGPHLSTPPMFYREWMLCVIGSAIRSATRDLEAQVREAPYGKLSTREERDLKGWKGKHRPMHLSTRTICGFDDEEWPCMTARYIEMREFCAALATATPPSPEVGA